jgi:hypothetical protein
MKKLFLVFLFLSILLLNGWNTGRASLFSSFPDISSSLSLSAQDAGQVAKTDSITNNAGEKDKPFNWKGLIIGLFFLSFYGYAITMIVITLVQTKKILPVTREEFKSRRKLANKAETAPDEENQQASSYVEEAFNSWKIISGPDEEELRSPMTMAQIKKSIELQAKAVAVMPTDNDIIDRVNQMGEVLNTQRERSFSGSWKLVIVAIVACFITYLMTRSYDPGFWHWVRSFWWMPLGIVLYYFASLAPAFLISKRARWFKGKNVHNVLIGTIMGLFLATPATETWVTKWSDGSKTKSEQFNPLFFIMLFLTFMLILVLGFMIIIFAGLNFIRNYVVYV